MTVVSVDLASKSYRDIGVVALHVDRGRVLIEPVRLESLGIHGKPTAKPLATFLAAFADELDARLIFLDGPQGWKSPDNGLQHARRCEKELATQGKTGLPGNTKPANYLNFISFSIEVFNELEARGFPRLEVLDPGCTKAAVESFPTSSWRTLGLKPLPGKRKANEEEIASKLQELCDLLPCQPTSYLTHDELQAAVSGLAGIAMENQHVAGYESSGVRPFQKDGTWREGYIVNPTPQCCGPYNPA